MPRPVLQLSGLCVEQNGITILRGIDWTIHRSEHWAILGLNGSGKTTLLQALLAHIPARSGSIELFGERYGRSDWREIRKKVAVISQAFSFRFPASESVARIVASGSTGQVGLRRPLTADEHEKIQPWIEQLGLSDRLEQPWRFLSQGERQRTLIARGFHSRPSLIILDEPCSGLDPVARRFLLERLAHASSNPHSPSIVYVTHHIEEIGPTFTHVLGLRDGSVVFRGSRDDALTPGVLTQIYGTPLSVEPLADGHFALRLSR